MPDTFPPRIHVLLAREAPYGVIIRRGPSRQVRFIGWNRASDEFEPAQWLNGRVYERRSDISPDGRHLIYFAANGKWNSESRGSWTAISRAPWMKAVSFYPKGDRWQGGGLFLDNRRYWLNGGACHGAPIEGTDLLRDDSFRPEQFFGGECPGVYYPRLQRDGWTMTGWKSEVLFAKIAVFEKELPRGWILRKLAHAEVNTPEGKGCYWDEHELVSGEGEVERRPEWEWAELDRDRLVWATEGRLHACSIVDRATLGTSSLLMDLTDMRYESIEAPY